MSSKPTLIFVPGAWHKASTWDKVTPLVKAQGYKVICVTLPSTMGNPAITIKEDVDSVRDPIIAETAQGRDVVVVMHSYGGAVGASAIKGLTRSKPDALPENSGHVIGLAYMASGFCMTGVGFLEAMGGNPPPFWKLDPSGFATLVVDARDLFYHDLPEDEGKFWVGKLQKQAQKPFTEGGEYYYAGWMDVPVWYLLTTDDHTHPVPIQQYIMQMGRDAGADVTVREIASSHSPMLSKPKETADFVLEAATALTR